MIREATAGKPPEIPDQAERQAYGMYISDRAAAERAAPARGSVSMSTYRYQAVSVGWWRGKVKRWNTTFHVATTDFTSNLHDLMQAMGYPNPLDIVGDCSGGLASIAVYAPTGGAPLSVTTYFDWETPSTWIPYAGTVWADVPAGTPLDASGESALVVTGQMPGLSATGKPVFTRKFFHAIPSRTAADYADPDVSPATQSAILALFNGGWMRNPAGVNPTTIAVEPFYGNHQRVRGRKRKVSTLQQEAYAAGVTVGAGAAAGGGGQPFQVQ